MPGADDSLVKPFLPEELLRIQMRVRPCPLWEGKTLELMRWDDGVTTNWLFPFAEQDGGTPFCFSARVAGLGVICLCSAGAGEGHLY